MKTLSNLSYGPHEERNLLDLYLPDVCDSPRPMVVCIHGGGWSGGDKLKYAWLERALTDMGFAAASVTYRFWPKWCWPAQLDDVQRAIRWLRRHATEYGIDPSRIGALGGSAGAHLASHLGLMETCDDSDPELAGFSSRVGCVVDCYGPVDLQAMMRSASAPIVEGLMGMPFCSASECAYRHASPLWRIGRFLPPFLIVHGTEDVGTSRGQVPLTISEDFAERLRGAGSDVSIVKLIGAPHGFSGNPESPHAQAMWKKAAMFFQQHLATNPG